MTFMTEALIALYIFGLGAWTVLTALNVFDTRECGWLFNAVWMLLWPVWFVVCIVLALLEKTGVVKV